MTIYTRKSEKVTTAFTKANIYLVYALLFITFALANLFYARGNIELLGSVAKAYGLNIAITKGLSTYIFYLIVNGLISIVVLEVIASIYYMFAFKYMRGAMPFTIMEFKQNLRPFIVLRNVIWGVLSATMFLQGGYTIGVGYSFFESLATMIIFFPMFNFMNKNYVAKGYSKNLLLAFAVPFFIFNVVTVVTSYV